MTSSTYQQFKICALLVCVLSCAAQPGTMKVRECQPIRINMCLGLGYNVTGMPNLVGHENQEDAEFQLDTFKHLINYECSLYLKFFLCSVYAPMCTEKVLQPIGPCRPLCELVRSQCEPVLLQFGFPWPESLHCQQYPPTNLINDMCMPGSDALMNTLAQPSSPIKNDYLSQCGQKHLLINITGVSKCVLFCNMEGLFTNEDRRFSAVWMLVWALLCFMSTTFSVLTFLVDNDRFGYPERCVFFMGLCHNLCSVLYLVRIIVGREAIICTTDRATGLKLIIGEGLQSTACTIVFLLIFYPTSAAAVWWTLMTLCWFLTTRYTWSDEAFKRHAHILHLFAWTLPALHSISILLTGKVEADELTGVCSIGSQSRDMLPPYVIIPFSCMLLLGVFFLIVGFSSVCRIREHTSAGQTERLELFVVRFGLFSSIYVISQICVIGCLFYEYFNHEQWRTDSAFGSRPNMEVFMLKLFMSVVVGIATGLWMWSHKTVQSWRTFCRKICSKNPRSLKTETTVVNTFDCSLREPAKQQVAYYKRQSTARML